MREISRLEDLVFGSRLSGVLKQEYSFFNNCYSEKRIDNNRIYSYLSKTVQLLTSLSLSYLSYKMLKTGEFDLYFVFPIAFKLGVHLTSNEIISGIREYKEFLKRNISRIDNSSDIDGEEWKAGTEYPSSDEL
jgi:hypothetical protein